MWECTLSCHEIDYLKDVESMKDHFQHMDDVNFIKDQILNHLEELTIVVIIVVLHCKVMVMSGPEYIISPSERNDFLCKRSIF